MQPLSQHDISLPDLTLFGLLFDDQRSQSISAGPRSVYASVSMNFTGMVKAGSAGGSVGRASKSLVISLIV
jgi:hypothetical protein